MMNFADCYVLPDGEEIDHSAPWDGNPTSHADGYLTGITALMRLLSDLIASLERGKSSSSPGSSESGQLRGRA